MSDPTLFDEPQFAPIPRGTTAPAVGDLVGLARRTDPSTSHRAAASLSSKLDERHAQVLAYLRLSGPSTDDQLADALVQMGIYERHEQARRAIRTLREQHDLIVPHLDADGNHAEAVNASGRAARLWVVR